jgi:prepilin-type N-terminal cleavage/methylation domain-containing protein
MRAGNGECGAIRWAGAFTLVELLTVVAILAVLASLLLPAVAEVREKARSAVCWSQLRQIGILASMYAQDFNDYVLPADLGGDVDLWINYMSGELSGSVEMFKCPSVTRADSFNPYGGNVWPYNQVRYASYIMNTIAVGSWAGAVMSMNPANTCGWGNGTTLPVRLTAVAEPAEKIFIVDSRQGIDMASARGIVCFAQTDHGLFTVGRDVGAHHVKGRFNSLFGDGHTVSMLRSEAEQWAAARWP